MPNTNPDPASVFFPSFISGMLAAVVVFIVSDCQHSQKDPRAEVTYVDCRNMDGQCETVLEHTGAFIAPEGATVRFRASRAEQD